MKTKQQWIAIKWPFSDAPKYQAWKCFALKSGRGRVILRPSQFRKGEFSYVASFGHNSERSHSGAFSPGFTLDQCKAEIEAKLLSGKI